jgi:ATP-dependent protease ClpP protease subunit
MSQQNQPQPNVDFRAVKNDKTGVLDLYIYDEIAWYAVSARGVAKALAEAEDVGRIRLFINSPGGIVWDALAIYNLLVRHEAPVEVFIDGVAASAATVIAMAGDGIVMAENALFMIHNVWGFTMGTAADHRDAADRIDKFEQGIIATYAARTGQAEKKIRKWVDAETWFTADEAIDAGFADRKGESKKIENRFDLSQYRNAPAEWKAQGKPATPNRKPPTAGDWRRSYQESLQVVSQLDAMLGTEWTASEENQYHEGAAKPQYGAKHGSNAEPVEGNASSRSKTRKEPRMDPRIITALRDLNLIAEGEHEPAAAEAALKAFYAATARDVPEKDVDQVLADLAAEPALYAGTLEARLLEARKEAVEQALSAVAKEHDEALKKAADDAREAARNHAADVLSRLEAVEESLDHPLADARDLIAKDATIEAVQDRIIRGLTAANNPIGGDGGGRRQRSADDPDAQFKAEYAELAAKGPVDLTEEDYVAQRRIDEGLDDLMPGSPGGQ